MKYLKFLIIFLIFCFGIVLGIILNDFPILKLNPEIRLFEPLTFLLTATIGVLLPFFIKRWIDDSRQIKNNLVDELKLTLREVEKIKERIKACYNNHQITPLDKNQINEMCEQADLVYNCLKQQLELSYKHETKQISSEIYLCYIDYWKYTTGAEIMSDHFTVISEGFFRIHNQTFAKFETIIKKAIITIHKL